MSEAATQRGYTEWQCAECGHGHPKNNPPCDRCGRMRLEKTRVTAADFDADVEPPTLLDEARERPVLTSVAALALLSVVALALAWPVTVHSPFGDAVYGPVPAEAPDADGEMTAGELRHRLDRQVSTTGMHWRGQYVQVGYETAATDRASFRAEVRHVVESYAAYVAAGGTSERLQVTVRVDGDAAGSYYVEREWVAGTDGSPGEDVVDRVIGTVGE